MTGHVVWGTDRADWMAVFSEHIFDTALCVCVTDSACCMAGFSNRYVTVHDVFGTEWPVWMAGSSNRSVTVHVDFGDVQCNLDGWVQQKFGDSAWCMCVGRTGRFGMLGSATDR